MAESSTCPPLIPTSIISAHRKIAKYIHRTPLISCQTLDLIASSEDPSAWLADDPPDTKEGYGQDAGGLANGHHESANQQTPLNLRLYFKCENQQRIGAFKARGAFHAVTRLIEEEGIENVRRKGVVTHSSGNHAQALALAAHTFGIPAYIVMPAISTPSKIAGTRRYTKHVIFSGSTSTEREAVVAEVQKETGAILVPPYDHPDIVLGQGTTGKEMEEQLYELRQGETSQTNGSGDQQHSKTKTGFDVVIAPIGGGGLLGGIATWFSDKPDTKVFGAEPSFEGADDARRGLKQGKRIEHVKSLTIGDGLRTPVGLVNWGVISDKNKLEDVFSVSEEEIKMAMRLVFERMKVVVEPSACVGLAVVMFNQEWRTWARKELEKKGQDKLDIGLVFSGGNTTMKAISALFADRAPSPQEERQEAKIGADGGRNVEDVAG